MLLHANTKNVSGNLCAELMDDHVCPPCFECRHLVEQKVDRLTEIVAKLSMRMQGGEESGSVQGIATS